MFVPSPKGSHGSYNGILGVSTGYFAGGDLSSPVLGHNDGSTWAPPAHQLWVSWTCRKAQADLGFKIQWRKAPLAVSPGRAWSAPPPPSLPHTPMGPTVGQCHLELPQCGWFLLTSCCKPALRHVYGTQRWRWACTFIVMAHQIRPLGSKGLWEGGKCIETFKCLLMRLLFKATSAFQWVRMNCFSEGQGNGCVRLIQCVFLP